MLFDRMFSMLMSSYSYLFPFTPRTPAVVTTTQWSTADVEIKDPSVENQESKGSLKLEVGHACFIYCQGFLPWTIFYLTNPFTFIFSRTSLEFFLY